MAEENPFAAPATECGSVPFDESTEGVWREGECVLFLDGAKLPDRCIACNRPANGKRRVQPISWVSGKVVAGMFALFLCGSILSIPLIVIVYNKFGRQAVINFGVCADHDNISTVKTWLGMAAILFSLAFLLYGGIHQHLVSVVLGVIGVFAGAMLAMARTRMFDVEKIEDGVVRIRGVNPEYLAMLPTRLEFDPQDGQLLKAARDEIRDPE